MEISLQKIIDYSDFNKGKITNSKIVHIEDLNKNFSDFELGQDDNSYSIKLKIKGLDELARFQAKHGEGEGEVNLDRLRSTVCNIAIEWMLTYSAGKDIFFKNEESFNKYLAFIHESKIN